MRETWMLLEYADRGNLDRALVQKKFMTPDGRLDLVRIWCLLWPHTGTEGALVGT